jgi:uncharacterized repeat protein (TIGR01451 family)
MVAFSASAGVERADAATAALALTKTHNGNFTAGVNADYSLSVANTGDGSTSGTLTVVDSLPSAFTFVAASGTGWTCSASGQVVTCTSTTAIASQQVAPSIDITVTPTVSGSVTNTATASGGGASNTATANDPTTILPSPATLGVTKSHSGNFTVGSLGTYTITASNSGGSATSGTVSVIDTLPTGLTYNSASGTGWTCSAAGQTVTCTSTTAIGAGANGNPITLNVNVLAAAVPSVTNTVSATGGGASNSPTANDPTTVNGAPALQANKTHSGNFVVGGQGTYTLSVTNTGTSPTTGTLTYVDTLPAAFTFASATGTGWTCSAAGQVVTCTTTTAVANGATSPTIALVVNVVGSASTVTNSATASGGGAGTPSTANNSTTIVNNVPVAGGTKSHVGNFVVGQSGVYTITPKNTGVQPSSGTVTVTDTLPAGFTYTSATGTGWTCAATGQVVTCTSTTVIAAGSSGNPITLTVAVGAAAFPSVTNSASINFNGSTATPTNPTQVDEGPRLVATKTHSGNFTDGQQGVWTLGVSNTGSTATTDTITLTDTLQAGLTFVSGVGTGWTCSAAGQVVTCTTSTVLAVGGVAPTIALTVGVGDAAVGTFNNVNVPSGGGAAYWVNATNSTTVNGIPRLGLTKSHTGTFYAGLQATYTLTPSNTGTAATTGTLTVVDTLPAGLSFVASSGVAWSCSAAGQVVTCTSLVTIAAGATGNTIGITVLPQLAAVPSVTNSATMSGGGATAPVTATDPTTVAVAPVLGVSKSHSGSFVVGQNGTYTITPINSGFQATSGTYTIIDNLPTGLTFVSATGTGWTCSAVGAAVTCTSSTVIAASGIGQPISLVVGVGAAAAPSVTNTASSSGGGAPNNGSASDFTTVTIPALSVTKTHTGDFVVGQSGSYAIVARNSGTAATFGTTTVTDTLPAGLTYGSASGSGWTCGDAAQVVTCTSTAAIAAGSAFPTITLGVTVPTTTTPGSLTNSVSASGGGATNTATATDPTTIAQPQLAIAKTHVGSFPVSGTGSYTIAVTNTGNATTFGTTTVTDTLPAGLTYASATGTGWTCGAVAQVVTCTSLAAVAAAGAFPSITLGVTVPASTVPGSLTNSATASGGGASNTPVATDPTTISGAPVLTIAKSHAGTFTAGLTGTYAIAVGNSGNVTTAGTITVSDTLPTGLSFNAASGTGWTCSAAGAVVTCTSAVAIGAGAAGNAIALTVNVAPTAPASVTNTAGASGGGAANTPSASDPTTIVAPVLAITKTHTGSFTIGSTGSYSIAVSNSGTAATFGTITVTDTLPVGLTFNAASGTGWTCTGSGQTATCTSTTSIAAGAAGNAITLVVNATGSPGSLTNSVSASGGGATNTPVATDPTTLAGTPVLAIAKSHVGSFVAGSTGTYTIAVSNSGNVATSGTVTVTDTLPTGLTFDAGSGAGWACTSAGATVTCTSSTAIAAAGSASAISLVVNVATNAPASVTNSANASGGGATNTPVATDPTAIVNSVLAISKTHAGNFTAGTTGTYAIAVSNTGTAATSGTITVTDTLPTGLTFNAASGTGWTCSAAGAVVTCTSTTSIGAGAAGAPIALVANVAATAPASVTNSATATGGGAANTPVTTDPTTIVSPSLAIAKTHSGNFTIGSSGSYSIVVSNSGTAATSGTLTVTDTLPTGLTFNAASGTGWTCSGAAQTVTCTSTTAIAAGAAGNAIALTVNAVGSPGSVTNSATVSGGGATNTPVATDPTTLVGAAVLAIAKSHSGNFTAGQTGSYTIAVSNSGNVATSGTVTVTDTLPTGLTFNAATGTGWTCSAAGAVVTCTSATSIGAGAAGAPIALTVNVTASAAAGVTNSATTSGGGATNTPVATDPTTIVRPALAVTKTHSGNFVVGATGSYTIAVSNTGSAATFGTITVADALPTGLTFVSANGGGWTCTDAAQTVTCTSAATIAAGVAGAPIALTVNAVGPPGQVTNSVTASGGGATNVPVATDPTTLTGNAILAIAKSHTGTFIAGQTGSYTIVVSNSGNVATAGAITVSDTLPAGLGFASGTGSGWTCSSAGAIVTCTSATSIAAGANGSPISLVVSVAANAAASLTNSASATGGGATNTPVANDPTTIVRPTLAIAKTHAGNFAVGSTGTYAIAVTNTGSAATTGTIAVTDALPTGLTFDAASGTGWSCAASSQTVTCTSTTSIPAGGAATPISLVVNVLSSAVPQVTNVASVAGGGATNAPSASDPTAVSGTVTLVGLNGTQIDKLVNSVRSVAAPPGSSVTYTIGFVNAGNVDATNVVLTDPFPAGVTPVVSTVTLNGSTSGFTAAISGQTLTISIPVVHPATPQTISIGATVSDAATTGQTLVNVATLTANGAGAVQTSPATVFNGSADIVYDGTKGPSAPIAGATVAIVDPTSGKPIVLSRARNTAVASTANPQTTASDGSFSFALTPAQFGAPGGSETYHLTLSARGFRNRTIGAVFSSEPSGLLYTVTLTSLDGQALAIEGGFSLVSRPTTIANVLNLINNIPMFPVGTLEVQKQADRTTVSIGGRIVYTVTVDATQAFATTRIVDQLPAGVAYAPHSGTFDGAPLEPQISGLTQVWQVPSLAVGTHTLRYAVVVGPGANQSAALTNVVDVTAAVPGGGTVNGSGQATVRTIAGAFSDRLTILGRVVVGSADGGWTSVSRGVAGVRIVMEDGTTVVTDAQGRYSFQEVRPGEHVLRLDTSSLPASVRAFDTHAYNDPTSTVRLVHTLMDTRLLQDVIFVVEDQR